MAKSYSVEFTLEQYSKGIYVPTLYRYRDRSVPSGFRISTAPRKVQGSGINKYALSKFASGEWIPKDSTLKKIRAFEDRVKYSWLRASGVSKTQANIEKRGDFSRVLNIVDSYRTQATTHAINKVRGDWLKKMGVPEEIIQVSDKMSKSGLEKAAIEFGDPKISPQEKKFPSKEYIAKVALNIMAAFSHSMLSVHDVSDLYSQDEDSDDPIEELTNVYETAQENFGELPF